MSERRLEEQGTAETADVEMADAVETNSTGSSDYVELWIDLFLGKKGHEYFCDVDTEYITDRFNLINLQKTVSKFTQVIQYMVDELDDTTLEAMSRTKLTQLEADARKLYGLIHARYIITVKGLQKMLQKYRDADFCRCPRVHCNFQPLLPVGLHDVPGIDCVKLYCPSCEDLYIPKSSRHSSIDGAYFGTSFPGMFLQAFPEVVPKHPTKRYVPKVFGFDLHKQAQLARWQELQRLKLERELIKKGVDLTKNGGYKK
ncbi:AaceriACR087Cp [[Ashbya] aceris (nom. inval.)]|nr:AaceriACR087Cp [[Ashbya] aceris (nom. inval.)]